LHLATLNSIFYFWAHEVNLFRSVCNIPLSFSSKFLYGPPGFFLWDKFIPKNCYFWRFWRP